MNPPQFSSDPDTVNMFAYETALIGVQRRCQRFREFVYPWSSQSQESHDTVPFRSVIYHVWYDKFFV
jgi:hypothetical protein